MILTDYYRSKPDLTWKIGQQLGVKYGVIRLPDDRAFDPADRTHWLPIYKRYGEYGIKPIVIEPMPNCLHDHIKAGDDKRDECIEKVLQMFPIMDELDIRTICFNWMTYVGWTRTKNDITERGGALVTGFSNEEYIPSSKGISAEQLWDNYEYFLRAVLSEAERYGIRLALHPDDPPISKLGNVSRIMISYNNIRHAIRDIVDSPNLGVTFCQAVYYLMGEDLFKIIPELADKIMFIHFRNVTGDKYHFHETFHDNGALNMPQLLKLYYDLGLNVPIRVDHVPTMVGDTMSNPGYSAYGRLYAIGYLKGILETLEKGEIIK